MPSRNSCHGDGPRGGAVRGGPGTPAGDSIRVFRELLAEGLAVRVKATGRSMAPFLKGGETLTIRRVPLDSLGKGDLIFFTRPGGAAKIHRLIRKGTENGRSVFITKGDAVPGCDAAVPAGNVLGKVCLIEGDRRGRASIDLESPRWKLRNRLIALAQELGMKVRRRTDRVFNNTRPRQKARP
jgi:hypothetical protein